MSEHSTNPTDSSILETEATRACRTIAALPETSTTTSSFRHGPDSPCTVLRPQHTESKFSTSYRPPLRHGRQHTTSPFRRQFITTSQLSSHKVWRRPCLAEAI